MKTKTVYITADGKEHANAEFAETHALNAATKCLSEILREHPRMFPDPHGAACAIISSIIENRAKIDSVTAWLDDAKPIADEE